MATTTTVVTTTPGATTPAGFHIPWKEIDGFLVKVEEGVGEVEKFGPLAASIIGSFAPQLKPFLGAGDELMPRVRMIQLFSQMEQAAEGLDGDAQWNAMCDAAEAWARRNRPTAKAPGE